MRPTSLLGFAAGVLLAVSCVGTTPEPTLVGNTPEPTIDARLIADLAPACTGHAVTGAGALIHDDHALNHVVVLNATGQPFEWTEWTPQAWWPASTADAELVVCVGEREDVEIQVCSYYGSDITRYAAVWPVTSYEPSTGKSVARFDITANARACGRVENMSVTALHGSVDEEDVQSYLAGLVEHGVFVWPSLAPSGSGALPGETAEPGETVEPGVESTAPSHTGRTVGLRDALADGSVTVSGTGDGLARLDLNVTSKSVTAIDLVVAAGTLLTPAAKGTQTMVVLWDQTIGLMPRETATATLDVACAEMHQDQPTNNDTFTISNDAPDADLILLLAAPELTAVDGRVRQFAVWTITNDPKRNGYVPLGTTFQLYGTGPDEDEIAAIRALFEAAGIDADKHRALR